jgi:hypothetical protein
MSRFMPREQSRRSAEQSFDGVSKRSAARACSESPGATHANEGPRDGRREVYGFHTVYRLLERGKGRRSVMPFVRIH